MKRVLVVLALSVLVFAGAAMATDITVKFNIDWGDDCEAYNVFATARLWDGENIWQSHLMTPNATYDYYEWTFENVPSGVDSWDITWGHGEYVWLPDEVGGDDPFNFSAGDSEATNPNP